MHETNTVSPSTDGQKSHSVGKRHRCPKPGCGKTFSRPSHLERHALNHSEAQFSCPRCHASFKRLDLLERHRSRHTMKDRLAGGLGLGILHTKMKRKGSRQSKRPQAPESLHTATDVPMAQPEGQVSSLDQVSPSSPDNQASHLNECEMIDIYELGNLYHDVSFDSVHFNVTGAPDETDMPSYLFSNSPEADRLPAFFDWNISGGAVEGSGEAIPSALGSIEPPNMKASATAAISQPLPFPAKSLGMGGPSLIPPGQRPQENDVFLDRQQSDTVDLLQSLRLNSFTLSVSKRQEIIDFISQIRPVYPDGSTIDENTTDMSLESMQEYLDLFFENFNYSYPLIHRATFAIAESEPIFLLSIMVLGATYKGKDAHSVSVCIFDAIVPHILGGLLSIQIPDLTTLQAFLILECYGMYRAGPHQRESAILIHTLLFNAIRRISRYHVRGTIALPELLSHQQEDWRAFAYAEQYKRLILFVFMWDTQNVSYYSFMPSMSTQSIQVELPCLKELWEAESEISWKSLPSRRKELSTMNDVIKDLIEDGGTPLSESLDGLSLTIILHGLMSMCNDMVHFKNQSVYLGDLDEGEKDGHQWRWRMTHTLGLLKTRYDSYAMEKMQEIVMDSSRHTFQKEHVAFLALYHTAHIVLHADIRHLQIAAGSKAIFGHIATTADHEESTAMANQWARITPNSASHAVWHAAQMFREGLLNLKNWDANGVFHYPWCLFIGSIACWAFYHFTELPSQKEHPRHCHERGCLDAQSSSLMRHAVSQLASTNPANIQKTLRRCCPHGLAVEIAKNLRNVRWTAAFEAMKVLNELSGL
ncbi:fungal-specific transcription factor domain-containing protein [Xylariaceae sp. FL0016]|nr:fungal-specific transcription factor domain-containing protein [Xylariaceae sp. FL0016]